MKDSNDKDIQAIQSLIEDAQVARQVDPLSRPYVIRRDNQIVESVEHLLSHPTRKMANPSFRRSESFIRYVNEQKLPETRIYCQERALIAVFNHHQVDGAAGWGDHRATYTMTESAEWKLWTSKNGQRFIQKDFGQFIEDNLQDVADPPSADLVEMVRQFEATSTVEYKSFDRGTDGNFSVSYVQTTQNKAGQKGQVELPRQITIAIPAFEGGQREPILAKLRFDIGGGRLTLWYELQRIQQVLDRHIAAVVASVATETEIEPFYGTP